ncbi:MAG TPA: right-handed parallel beta-helix repeat-containing protein [Candidatus Hydrogenedentes bacterium]|nr:right-handed parallel beta-helix repeat-containing protein [Candidatus Hydrogenedentota bacterium]HPG65979.1 right-handed parallel beta-helix repeat-containing protein [Candidatus Hydrogenedentota bacterium]
MRFGLCGALLLIALAGVAESRSFYVALDGDDANPGTEEAPYATVSRVRDAIRALKANDALPVSGVTVSIRSGRYFLDEAITLGPEDSGTEESPIVYAAYPGEAVILSGGRAISGWKPVGGNRWEVELADVAAGTWYFRQLFADGKRLTRARIPNEGFLTTAGALSAYAEQAAKRYGGYSGVGGLRKKHPDAYCGFSFSPGDIEPWTSIENAEVITYHSWECSWQTIRRVDFEKCDLYFNTPCRYPVGFFSLHCRYHVESVPEALDAPGEWYLDRKRGVLTYLARPGEDPNAMDFVAPFLERLLVLDGDPEHGRPVEYVSFSRLSFQHARYPMGIYDVARDWPKAALAVDPDWPTDFAPGYTDAQASPQCGQAIGLEGARHCGLVECEVTHVGASAIRIALSSHENQVIGCTLHDLGGGGVFVGADIREVEKSGMPSESAPSKNVIANNRIYDGGRVHPSAVGIWIAQSRNNTVAHNDIFNLGYSGISLGWTWNDAPNYSDHNVIEGNHIHHVLQELADGGGIYTLGVLDGCVLRANHIHDIRHPAGAVGSHNNGFFFDQSSRNLLAERNVIHTIGHDDVRFNQNKREDHQWVNNIFEGEGGDIGSEAARAVIDSAGVEKR